jgi:hypothetical protein
VWCCVGRTVRSQCEGNPCVHYPSLFPGLLLQRAGWKVEMHKGGKSHRNEGPFKPWRIQSIHEKPLHESVRGMCKVECQAASLSLSYPCPYFITSCHTISRSGLKSGNYHYQPLKAKPLKSLSTQTCPFIALTSIISTLAHCCTYNHPYFMHGETEARKAAPSTQKPFLHILRAFLKCHLSSEFRSDDSI